MADHRQQPPKPQTQQAPPATGLAKQAKGLEQIIAEKQSSFAEIATPYLSAERLVKLAQVMVSKMPDLRRVQPLEVVAALIDCARLGLEPNVEGGRWLLPFKRRGQDNEPDRWEIVAVTDYRGLIDVARRSGEVLAIHADVVRERDLWEFWVGSDGPTLVHLRHRRAADADRGEILGAYAIVRLRNGEVQADFLPLEKINESRARSRGADSTFSPWQRDFDAMAKKTAIRRLYNLLPKTPEIQIAREVLAAEEQDGDTVDVDAKQVPASSRTEGLKDALRRQVGKADPAPKPEPTPPEGPETAEQEAQP